MSKIIIFLTVLLLLLAGLWFYLGSTYPTTSPLNSTKFFIEHIFQPHAKLNKHVIGFLPYWRIDDMKYARLDLLSEINYFSLSVNKDGQLVKVINNQTDPGWREWNNEALKNLIAKSQIMGASFTFTIAAQKNSIIESLLDNKNNQQTLISNIIEQIKTRHLNGVNIDFEYTGDADEIYRNEFTDFSKLLSASLHKEVPNATLALSIMPRAARDKDIFDFPKLVPFFDRFIGMSYDYYGINSDIAGPVAPMKGFEDNKFFFDVQTTYQDYLKYIPKNKIIMGIPYYGWDWSVEDGKKPNSRTFPSSDPKNYAAVLSFARMKEDPDLILNQCKWDDYAQENWCWYSKDNTDHQVWYEDTKSIGIKYDFANKQNFSGTAIWVLGYDKDYPDLWNLMKDKFTK